MEKHLVLGLLVPVVFFVFTGMVKSIVKKDWIWSNFYLGIDIALAALANGIVNILDDAHQMEGMSKLPAASTDFGNQMFYTSLCILAAVGALFGAMVVHQRYEEDNQRWKRGIWLGVIGNLLGGAVLGMFIFMKLRRLV